jgi:hypothetical protein
MKIYVVFVYNFGYYIINKIIMLYNRKSDLYKDVNNFSTIIYFYLV